jgi:hypothetical protein
VLRELRVFVPAVLLAAAACSHSGGGEVRPTEIPVSVEVTNNNALPMEVSAFGSNIAHRLGTVNPGLGSHFTIPKNLIGNGSVQLEARPSGGGRAFRSGEILLSPGAVVDFIIDQQLFNSTVTRRP